MNALFIFAATFAVVLFLGLQSLNVNGGHKLLAVLTSFGIGVANLFILKVIHRWAGTRGLHDGRAAGDLRQHVYPPVGGEARWKKEPRLKGAPWFALPAHVSP